jgi:peptidyl-prolyl cis-trans isomerase A (cyclophilin A)
MFEIIAKTMLLTLFLTFGLTTTSCADEKQAKKKEPSKPGLYALFNTTKGTITCQLFEKEAPKTVANFTGLADGTKEWTDPKTGKKTKSKFYDGLIFHRVIPKFMIQGGDPEGTGRGGPGYKFEDEFTSGLLFDKPGRLAMANAGPNTNGSQFFITTVPTPWLNNKHTIFGQVIDGMDVVEAIESVKRDRRDKPTEDVAITTLEIKRVQ